MGRAERSYYEDLLNAGVKIYKYNAPILLHSKTMSIDDDMAVIGSSNLDMRSFQLNLEVTLICYASQVVADLRQIEANYMRKSKQVNLKEWKTRSAGKILFENISRLTAALQFTIAEKALAQVFWLMQHRPPWIGPEVPSAERGRGLKALVLGVGPVGLLGAMVRQPVQSYAKQEK